MSTEVSEVLRHLHTLFRKCLNFQSISPHLRSHYLLTDNEWEIISKKESREDQVDEFLKCLPHKGKGCLKRLIECLELSLDHSGHQDLINELNKQPIADVSPLVSQSKSDYSVSQDEFERAVSTISSMYSSQKETMAALMEQLNQQEAKIKQLQLTCDNQAITIQELSDTVSTQKTDITNLNVKLKEKEKLLFDTSWPNNIVNGYDSYVHFEDHSMSISSSSSQDSVLSNDSFKCGPPPVVVTDSNEHSDAVQDSKLSPNMHSKLVRNSSIEDRMKIYQKNMASYREKCHQLEAEKARLKEAKQQLEQEVAQLRGELDAISLTSSINSITFQSHLDSGLAAQNIQAISMPDNMYLNGLYQGWLTKEGGHKKSRKRRWCILSSRFFFYFEDKKVELKSQKPIGILPLTKDMEVTDCKRDNIFEVHEKLRGTLKSCKLDKNRGVYIPGNHAVYNLQATCDDDKRGWIKAFEGVLESLKLYN